MLTLFKEFDSDVILGASLEEFGFSFFLEFSNCMDDDFSVEAFEFRSSSLLSMCDFIDSHD